jgi:hypothetical protein
MQVTPLTIYLRKKVLKSLFELDETFTFALPFQKWVWTYVTENQNKITVFRPQLG